jgi:hypothetical protein
LDFQHLESLKSFNQEKIRIISEKSSDIFMDHKLLSD